MASTLAQPEALAGAVFDKAPKAPLTPGSVQEAASKIRSASEQKGLRSALEPFRQKPIEQKKLEATVDKAIGVERDASGKKVRASGSLEAKRFQEAKEADALSIDFSNKGYDGLDSTKQAAIRDRVERVCNMWPEGKASLAAKSPDDRKAAIEAIIRSPSYIGNVRAIIEGSHDPSKIPQEGPLLEAKRKYAEAQKNEDEKNTQISRNDGEKTRVNDQLRQFEDLTNPDGTPVDNKFQKLKELDKDMPVLQADLSTKQDQLDELKDVVGDLEQVRRALLSRGLDTATIDAELMDKRTQLRATQKEVSGIGKKIAQKDILEKERTSLEQKKQQLTEERAKLDEELRRLSQDRALVAADLAGAELDRSTQEDEFVDRLKGTFSEAALRELEDKISQAEAGRDKLLAEEAARVTDPDEKKIIEARRSRWETRETKGSRTYYKLNKDQIRRDYSDLITDGPQKILKDILMANTGLTPGTPAYLAEEARIADKLQDPNFIAKVQPAMVEQLITRQLMTGKILEDDVHVIRDSDWGQGMVEKAIQNKADFKRVIDELYGKGAVESGSFWRDLKKKSDKNVLKFLLLLLGTAFFGSVPIYGAIKNSLEQG